MTSARRRVLGLLGGSLAVTGSGAYVLAKREHRKQESGPVDDWQYDPDDDDGLFGFLDGLASSGASGQAASGSGDVGLTAGGAADANTFRRNVEERFLPIPESITPEGVFHQYYFDTDSDEGCSSVFCPRYSTAVSPDPLSGEPERYLTVGLDSGISAAEFARPRLNLVVVLDISGSMSSGFAEYYYDRYGNRQQAEDITSRAKIDVATEALASLTKQLDPEDRLGIVLFNRNGHLAKPLRKVGETDMEAIRGHIREDIEPGGGTNLSAGLAQSEQLISEYTAEAGTDVENRTILLTDAQINAGQTDDGQLRTRLAENADEGHHTTVVGIGVDFNAELVDAITSVRGANYYSVHSADEFERRVGDHFEYMVSPLVYDLSLELDASDHEIARVYGSNTAEESADELVSVTTLFPSPPSEGKTRGSVVLVELERSGTGDGDTTSASTPTLKASWETRSGDQRSTTERVQLPGGDDERYDGTAIRKAILLARYAELLTNWTIYERDQSLAGGTESIEAPPGERVLGRWEQRSEPLSLSERYESRLRTFRDHLRAEREALGDKQLDRELELLRTVLETARSS